MIVLRFSAGNGPAATLVRAVTWSWSAHVGFSLGGHILDATPELGVEIRPTPKDDDGVYFRVEIEPDLSHRVINLAAEQIGKPYDFVGAFGVGIHRDWQNEGKWFCSELVAWSFLHAGYPLLRTEHLSRITPRDLLLSPMLIRETPRI